MLQLPGAARSISYEPDSRILALSMALSGVAFYRVDDGQLSEVTTQEDWPTLHAMPLGNGQFLLARRFGSLQLVQVEGDGVRELDSWETEGLPVHITSHEDRLYMAAGGQGLKVYDWNRESGAPRLRARYPFVDFSKQVAVDGQGLLFLADNLDTGLQILDVGDPERPTQLHMENPDFVDSVDFADGIIAYTARHEGVRLLRPAGGGAFESVGSIPIPGQTAQDVAIVTSIQFIGEGRLLVTEAKRGARLLRLTGSDPEVLDAFENIPELKKMRILDGLSFGDGDVAFSGFRGQLLYLPGRIQ